jgi:SAM-dependent methyltransferase
MGPAAVKPAGGNGSDRAYWDGVAGSVSQYYLIPPLADLKAEEYRRLLADWEIGRSGLILFTDLYEAAYGQTGFYQHPQGKFPGMDISPLICGRARANLREGRLMAFCGDSRAMPLADSCLDAVVSPSTLDHFPQIDLALGECRRVLRPGGRLVLVLNSASNPLFRTGVRLAERFKGKEYQADYFYTLGQARELLSRSGFLVGRSAALMHLPVGMTTVIEGLARIRHPLPRKINEMLIDACRRWGRARTSLKFLTGWWVAVEGIK